MVMRDIELLFISSGSAFLLPLSLLHSCHTLHQRRHGKQSFRHIAGVANQTRSTAFIQWYAILLNGKGFDLLACKDGSFQLLIHAEQPVDRIDHDLVRKRAEADLPLDLELFFQLRIFFSILPIRPELFHRHVVHIIIRQIHTSITVIAYQLSFDLPREHSLRCAFIRSLRSLFRLRNYKKHMYIDVN